jgi:hypothetical protein
MISCRKTVLFRVQSHNNKKAPETGAFYVAQSNHSVRQ